MKRKNVIFSSGVLAVVAVLLILSVTAAQDTGAEKAQCKVAVQYSRQCKLIMATPIYLDSPAVIYGQAEMLKLTAEQKEQLKKIENETRKKALALLTPEQREQLGEIPAEPITLAQICGKMPCGQGKGATIVCPMTGKKAKTCPIDCTKPCCAVKTKACPPDCTKACCAAKDKPTAAVQTVCPIMGGKINKSVFTEYKGKKVYFCCAGCKPTFEKNPEKYIAKLPQFKD